MLVHTTTKDAGLRKLSGLAPFFLFFWLACGCLSPAVAKDRVVTGVIVGFDCGESPYLIVEDARGKKHQGACYEKWCEKAAWEKKWCPDFGEDTANVSRQYLGKTISATVRLIMIEEAGDSYDAVYDNEFFDIEFISSP